MRNQIKKLVPSHMLAWLRKERTKVSIMKDYIYDFRRYIKYSSALGQFTQEQMKSYLVMQYHSIEKGLTLSQVKVGFGADRIKPLMDMLVKYVEIYGKDETTDITIDALNEYANFEKKNNTGFNSLLSHIERITSAYYETLDGPSKLKGGTKVVRKSDIIQKINFDYDAFFKSRYSTRDFTEEFVSSEMIFAAIETAKFAPSVCNRQAWKVFIVDHTNEELKEKFLNVQNGNSGFRQQIKSLLIITGKLSSFYSYERNQVFIDGGMFAMSILLALHAKGLGTCCLNTSYNAGSNESFRKVAKLDPDVVPIMYIAIGHLKDEYKIAVSERKSIKEIATIL